MLSIKACVFRALLFDNMLKKEFLYGNFRTPKQKYSQKGNNNIMNQDLQQPVQQPAQQQPNMAAIPVAYGTWTTIERGGGSVSWSSMGACFAMHNGAFYIFNNAGGQPPFINGMPTREPQRVITPNNISGFEFRKLNQKQAKFRFYCPWEGQNYCYQVTLKYKPMFGLAKRNPTQAEAVAAIVATFEGYQG